MLGRPFHIQLLDAEGQRLAFTAAPEQSVLEAALAAGLAPRRSCRNGSCRACLCRLELGQIAYRIDWPGLSAEEKAAGWILPCVAEARSDLNLRYE
ncbi:2Fe-2S iron-sulfur cluster-binding protein [Paucibacter sp. APW11]|uniref:2Fe-2S iron-sulfur cluster-binding protein n=2 Tax=Roseateles aquae TaxID=3077235 RepID=A0ABU3PAN9_9BURK|nr:2Fe-2S iron-sulfur cluster-binding protein [Paucibacter sp. APW11]